MLSAFVLRASAAVLHGQSQADQKPLAFEVASIKPNVSRQPGSFIDAGAWRQVYGDQLVG